MSTAGVNESASQNQPARQKKQESFQRAAIALSHNGCVSMS